MYSSRQHFATHATTATTMATAGRRRSGTTTCSPIQFQTCLTERLQEVDLDFKLCCFFLLQQFSLDIWILGCFFLGSCYSKGFIIYLSLSLLQERALHASSADADKNRHLLHFPWNRMIAKFCACSLITLRNISLSVACKIFHAQKIQDVVKDQTNNKTRLL